MLSPTSGNGRRPSLNICRSTVRQLTPICGLRERRFQINRAVEETMDIYGYCQGFRQVHPIAKHFFPIFRSKTWCIHGCPTSVVFPPPLISATFQAAKNEAVSRKFYAPMPFFSRKILWIVANSYSRDQGSREDSASQVETPQDSNLDENPASQTTTVNGDERVSNRAESVDEIGKALNDIRKEKLGDESRVVTTLWRGVLEETAQIEWPSFQKVLGTTGVVLAVMIGSSAVLLTLNAIFAEVSDKVFHGMGVQDIFGGGISIG